MKALILLLILFVSVNCYSAEIKILKPDPALNRHTSVLSNTAMVRFKQGFDVTKISNILKATNARTAESLIKPEQTITYNFTLKNSLNIQSSDRINNMIKAEEPLLRTFEIQFDGDTPPEKFCFILLANNPDIEIAEPYACDELLGSFFPNDPKVTQQGMLNFIGAFQAWSVFKGDTNVIIGISDFGVLQQHEDLIGNIAPNWGEIPDNGIDDDNNGYVDDYFGYNLAWQNPDDKDENGIMRKPGDTYNAAISHGTNCAGISAATTNNGVGMAGVGFKCRLFPIKAAVYNDPKQSISYGYKSILYAAIRGCKVLNCSWGSVHKAYSGIDQTILDFALSRDVAIVAAAGNLRFDIKDTTDIYLPAGYFGVLGVGEISLDTVMTGSSMIGSAVRVMAPGFENLATNNSINGYEHLSAGTSFAAPVVTGVVAFIRAKYPQLNAIQSLEFARQSSYDISAQNPMWKSIIPGRINMAKAASTDPFSIPAIYPIQTLMRNTSGDTVERFSKGDTFAIDIKAHNYLGEANNLRFVASVVRDYGQTVQMLDSTVIIPSVGQDKDLSIKTFKFIQQDITSVRCFFRIDIYGDNSYHDFFLIPYVSSVGIKTFANPIVKFSVRDNGTFASGDTDNNYWASGFLYKNFRNQLYKAGIMATARVAPDTTKVISALFSVGGPTSPNDFRVVKPFAAPNDNIGILDDSNSAYDQRIGLRIQQEFDLSPYKFPVAQVRVKVTNISGRILNDVSVGYFFDWDIGYTSDSNSVRLFPEAIPTSFTPGTAAAEIEQYPGSKFPAYGSAVYSLEGNYEAQAAGLSYDMTKNFTIDNQIAALNTGTVIQHNRVTDCSYVVGMRFPGEMMPNAVRTFKMCFGSSDDATGLAYMISQCMQDLDVPQKQPVIRDLWVKVIPQPAEDNAVIKIDCSDNSRIQVRILDIFGINVVNPIKIDNSGSQNTINVDLNKFSSGKYLIEATNGTEIIVKPLIVIK